MELSAASVTAASEPVQPRVARLRAFARLDWWPHGGDSAGVPMWVHVLFWCVLLLLDGLNVVFNHNSTKTSLPILAVLLRSVLTNVLSAALFYSNWMLLIPRTLAQGRLGAYIGGVLLLLLLYVPLRFGASSLISVLVPDPNAPQALHMIVPYSLLGLMTIFFSSGLRITGDYLRGQRNRRELERQQLLTELSLLKMQVNPHFLFNTLNNIYSLASQKSDRAPEAVLRLSEIMRYMLYESSADTVPLTKELGHLRSFLDLQRLRLPANGAEAIVFRNHSEANAAWPIAPMLLQPLVENAFKHGDLSARPAVSITLKVEQNGRLCFVVENAMGSPAGGASLAQPGGVGLANLRRRLELLYPQRHQLLVSSSAATHRVQLDLQLN